MILFTFFDTEIKRNGIEGENIDFSYVFSCHILIYRLLFEMN